MDASRIESVSAGAKATLLANDRGGYTVPNKNVYPFQWNWDSAFVAMGFATFDVERAWQELETLFLGQWADGMVPSIVFHQYSPGYYPGPYVWEVAHVPPTTGISQPPVAATAARIVLATAVDKSAGQARAKALFPKLFASHRWWHEVRDPDATGLVTIVHPWETGRDNSPEWDQPLANVTPRLDISVLRKDKTHVNASERPTDDFYNRVMTLVEEAKALNWDGVKIARSLSFRVCDIGIQSILMRADRDLLALAQELGFAAEAQTLKGWIARSQAGFALLRHSDGTFRSMDLITGELATTITSASFLPLYARACGGEDAALLARLLEAWLEKVRYCVPSTDPSSPAFDPDRYWRGPVWLVINRMIADGFAAAGHTGLAGRIEADTRALVAEHGLAEYFSPLTGAGLGGRDFSWSAAVWLAWTHRESINPVLT